MLAVSLVGMPVGESAEQLARAALERMLGLRTDLAPFAAMAEHDPWLGPLAHRMRGLKPPRFPTVFEALVNGIACQQLSLVVGIHLLNRLTAAHGCPRHRGRRRPPRIPRSRPARQSSTRIPQASWLQLDQGTHDRRGGPCDRRGRPRSRCPGGTRRSRGNGAPHALARRRSLDRRVRDAARPRQAGDLPRRRRRRPQQASAATSPSTPRWTTRASSALWPAGSPTRGWSTSTCCSTRSPGRDS